MPEQFRYFRQAQAGETQSENFAVWHRFVLQTEFRPLIMPDGCHYRNRLRDILLTGPARGIHRHVLPCSEFSRNFDYRVAADGIHAAQRTVVLRLIICRHLATTCNSMMGCRHCHRNFLQRPGQFPFTGSLLLIRPHRYYPSIRTFAFLHDKLEPSHLRYYRVQYISS